MTIIRAEQNVLGALQGTSNKNFLINPSLRYWQALGPSPAAVSASTAESLCADGWYVNPGDTGGLYNYTVSRYSVLDADRTSIGDESAEYGVDLNVTSIANNTNRGAGLVLKCENVRKSGNKVFTLSFWAKCPTPKTMSIRGVQHFGVAGSTTVETAATSVAVGSAWQKVVVKLTFPSLSGKVVDANDAQNWFGVSIRFDANTTGRIQITQPQLELGSSVSAFQLPDPLSELSLCQRYFEKTYAFDTAPGTITEVGSIRIWDDNDWVSFFPDVRLQFKQVKLYAPTASAGLWKFYNPTTGTADNIRNESGNIAVDVSKEAYRSIHQGQFAHFYTITATNQFTFHFVAKSSFYTRDY